MQRVELLYYAKKAFALFPGLVSPVSAPVFREHYALRLQRRSRYRACVDILVGTLFHLWIPLRARAVQKKFGKDGEWRRRATAIAHARFVDPNDLALFRIERAAQLDNYIRRFEDAAFNKLVNPQGWSRRCVLVDKRLFYERCVAHGIRHPAVIAILNGDRLEKFSPAAGHALIVKPSHGEGGRGVARLPAAMAEQRDAQLFRAALLSLVSRREGAWIVQVAVDNHPALREYAMDALCTARMTTMINERGQPELVSVVLRMASRRGPVIDNMKAGGLIMPVNPASGRVGIACMGYGGGDFTHHPVSGAPLRDLVLPDWAEAVALVCTAHSRAFSEYTIIGWDVAFAPDGPVIIEGNSKPGVLMPQRSSRCGLASQRYGEILAWQLAAHTPVSDVKGGKGRQLESQADI